MCFSMFRRVSQNSRFLYDRTWNSSLFEFREGGTPTRRGHNEATTGPRGGHEPRRGHDGATTRPRRGHDRASTGHYGATPTSNQIDKAIPAAALL